MVANRTIVAANIATAYLGMGIMGAAMAANLARGGVKVKVWNRTTGKPGQDAAVCAGASASATVGEAVADCQIIFACLGDEKDLEEVVWGEGGVAASAKSGALFVDMSTSGPQYARTLAKALEDKGLRFLDAPVTGGDIGAANGTLTIMVGGHQADFDRCLPLFKLMGNKVVLCGGHGSGQAIKLCNQVLCAVNMMAVCEAIDLARTLQVDPALVVDVCGSGAAGSWALTNLGPRILKDDLMPGFKVEHMLKDLRLVRGCLPAQRRMPGVELAASQFRCAIDAIGTTSGERGTQAMIAAYLRS